MARILAVDWDSVEVRFVHGVILKDRLTVTKVGAAPIEVAAEEIAEEIAAETALAEDFDDASEPDEDDGVIETVEKDYIPRMPLATDDDDDDDEDEPGGPTVVSTVTKKRNESFKTSPIAKTLKQLLKESRVGSGTLVYVAERSDLDVMYMTIPNASETETPELIFNQALRDSLTFNETQPLDFMSLGLPDTPKRTGFRRVVAVSIARDKLRRIRETLSGAYRAPAKIELREPSLAEFLRVDFCGLTYQEPVVLIQELCDEANLTICYQKSPLFFRSFKLLPEASAEERANRIRDEIARTLAVGIDDLPEDTIVNHALFFTDYTKPTRVVEDDEKEEETPECVAAFLEKYLAEDEIQLDFINPFRVAGMRVKTQEPETPGRYASLLGAILADRPQGRPWIDLLHPHEKPKPPNFTLLFITYFLVVILAATGLHFWNKSDLRKLNDEIAQLEQEQQEVATNYNQKWPAFNVLQRANNWQNSEGVIILDELRDIFVRLPKSPDVVVTRLAYMSSYSGFGPMHGRPVFIISAKITGYEAYQQFYRQIQLGGAHQFVSNGPVANPGGGGYRLMFEGFIVCQRRNAQSLLAVQPDSVKQISMNRPEYFVEREEIRKREIAEAQEKNFDDAVAIAEQADEILNADPAAGESVETTVEQDQAFAAKLVELRKSLQASFNQVQVLSQNGALTTEQFNKLRVLYVQKDNEIVAKWRAVNVRVQLKSVQTTLLNARKILDAALEAAKEPTPENDEQLRVTLLQYRQVIDSQFMQMRQLLQNGLIDQAQFDAAQEKYQSEVTEVEKEFADVVQRIRERNFQNQNNGQNVGAPVDDQPADTGGEDTSSDQSAESGGDDSSSDQSAESGGDDSSPDQSAESGGDDSSPDQSADSGGDDSSSDQPAETGGDDTSSDLSGDSGGDGSSPDQSAESGGDDSSSDQSGDSGGDDSSSDQSAESGGDDSSSDQSTEASGDDSSSDPPAESGGEEPTPDQSAAPEEDQSAPPQALRLTTRLEFV